MDKLSALHQFAEDNGIGIVNESFSDTKKAACVHLKPFKYVILDRQVMESSHEETSVLAEEIGHYETGALYIIESTHNMPISRSNRIKYEAKARHWAYKEYCPPDEIEKAVESEGHSDYAVAEYCQVTVEFFRRAVEYHRSCGVKFSFDNSDDCA